MTRFDEAKIIWMAISVLAFQSCISAEDPKVPPPQSGATGGAAPGQGGSAATGGEVGDTGGADPSTGGAEGLGGDQSTGGAEGLGGDQSTGGEQATGGLQATGGSPTVTGGSASASGGVSATTGGSISSGGCNFDSASCTAPCASFASSPASSWKQAPCEKLLACLEQNASCIAAADPLCGPKQAPSYAPPVCGNDYYDAASDSDISSALTTHIECVCGF